MTQTIAERLREIADDFIVKAPNGGILSERQQYWELRKIADELDAKAQEIVSREGFELKRYTVKIGKRTFHAFRIVPKLHCETGALCVPVYTKG